MANTTTGNPKESTKGTEKKSIAKIRYNSKTKFEDQIEVDQ